MFPSKFLQFPSILTHFHAANEKIQNGGRDLAIFRGLVWVKAVSRHAFIGQDVHWILIERNLINNSCAVFNIDSQFRGFNSVIVFSDWQLIESPLQ